MKFCASYNYAGKKWGLIIDAESWPDAAKRCKQLNLTLDGELLYTRPAKVTIDNTKNDRN